MIRATLIRPTLIWAALIRRLQARRIRRAALFDAQWYLDSYPDLAGSGVDPARHYLANGAAEGRDPGPLFSTSGYRLAQDWGAQVLGAQNPLLHHLARPGAAPALPVFAGTGPAPRPGAPVVLFFAHQALGHVFGAERSLLDMLERAREAGLAAEVVLPQALNPGYLADLRARATRVHLLPCAWIRGGQPPHPATLAAMTALIRNSHATEVHQNTLVLDAPLIAARAAGVPSVVHVRELPAEDPALCARLGLSAQALRQHVLALANRFVANSDAVAQWLDAGRDAGGQARCTVVPNRIDPALYSLPFAPADPPRVGLISSNTAKKGLSDVLAMARRFDALGGRAQFLLIGPMSADLAALLPLPDNVRHAGHAASALEALAQVDVVLSLSQVAESYGRTVHEALAAGRPVICNDRGTPPALVGRDGQAGHVVPAGDSAAAAAALLALLADGPGLRAASDAARLRAQQIGRDA